SLGWGLLTAGASSGGLKAVIWEGVSQGTILTIGVILLFFISIKDSSGCITIVANAQLETHEAMLDIFNITPTEILINLLRLSFFQFIRQDVWQRIWAAKSLKTARISYWISMIIAVTIGAIVVAIGVFSRFELKLGNIDPSLVYYHVIG